MECSATRDPHRGDSHRGPTQGTRTGDPHRGPTQRGGGTEDPPPEGRATQGTNTEHTQTIKLTLKVLCRYQLTAIGRFALFMYMSERRSELRRFVYRKLESRIT